MTRARAPSERLRILVLPYLVRGPLGGMAWHHLHYVLGLIQLGHDAYLLEDSEDYPACYDPQANVMTEDPGYGLRFAAAACERLGVGDRWAYHDAHTETWLGPCAERALRLCASADVLIGFAGVTPLRPWLADVPVRILIDTDPAFTQVRHLSDPAALTESRRFNAFFSFAENIGAASCEVPDDGLAWQTTRQPVALDRWMPTPGPPDGPFTTVMQWDSYPPREHDGRRYAMKSESFEPYLDLPSRTDQALELSVGSATAPRSLLAARGWRLRDPRDPTRDPWIYQDYIRASKGEFSVAKHGYVATRSGWFSERSACYLASGRPALVQDTGFSQHLPSGEGLLAFSSPEEALDGIGRIDADYPSHCRAARRVAEEHLDARRVLPALLERSWA